LFTYWVFHAVDLVASSAPVGPELQTLIEKVKNEPGNHQARYDLASAYFQAGKYQQAMDQCFELIKREKHWNEDAARKMLLKIFDALGGKDPLVKDGKARLGNLWFI